MLHGICLHELESNAASGELSVGIGAIFSMWVEHCRRSGEFLARLMVITDDEVDTASSCVCHFIHRLDTAVERDNKLAARR